MNKTCRRKEKDAQVRGKDCKATQEYTKDLVDAMVQRLFEDKVIVKLIQTPKSKTELERHQRNGHNPYDTRCKEVLLAGLKDRPHYRRNSEREENHIGN